MQDVQDITQAVLAAVETGVLHGVKTTLTRGQYVPMVELLV